MINANSQIKELEEEIHVLEIIKELPIWENSAVESSNKFLSLKEALYIYDTPIRLPFELPGIEPFIIVSQNEPILLILEKLNIQIMKDFLIIIKEIINCCTRTDQHLMPSEKIHLIGKWMLLNCSSFLSTKSMPNKESSQTSFDNSLDLIECIKSAKLFLNQNQVLCSANQLIDPLLKEKFLEVLDPNCIPSKDLILDKKCIRTLKELGMRNCVQLKVDEIICLYENSIKQNEQHRRLFAELIIDILINRLHESIEKKDSIEKALIEYSTTKAVTLKHFLMSVNWIPVQRDRTQSYPQTLFWKGDEPDSSENIKTKFYSPRDCVDSQFALCAGSVAYVIDLKIPTELKAYIDLKQVHLDVVVRHLKLATKCFESSALKTDWYDYLTVTKKCYEFINSFESHEVFKALKANDLNEWIWNGAGFSSLSSIFIITEKKHPLAGHVAFLPYELYVFVNLFERLGMNKLPDTKQLEQLLLKLIRIVESTNNSTNKPNEPSQLLLENAAKNYLFINWIKANYSNEKQLSIMIKDYEEKIISLNVNGHNNLLNPFLFNTSLQNSDQSISLIDNSSECIFLYFSDIYQSSEIKDNLINSVITLVKSKQVKILDEEAYLTHKAAIASNPKHNIYDHYRVYNEIILPNLNTLSKNVMDSVVLFALDHSDPKMLEILRDHPCIPVTPFGRLKKPNKLIQPIGKIASLYFESDERFPFGSKDTYIRDDRLQILKILGMKWDYLNWQEIVERAESVSKIKDYDIAVERSIVILNLLNEMLNENYIKNSSTTSNVPVNQQNSK